jgi:hypothetical protein
MRKRDPSICSQIVLVAQELSSILSSLLADTKQKDKKLLQRAADLAQEIEQRSILAAKSNTVPREFSLSEIADWIARVIQIIVLLSKIND